MKKHFKNIDRWKIRQIKYFKKYLKSLEHNTDKYHIIEEGIINLEKSL